MIFRSQKFETKRPTILTLVVSSFYEVYAQIDREITKLLGLQLLGVIENTEIECKLLLRSDGFNEEVPMWTHVVFLLNWE